MAIQIKNFFTIIILCFFAVNTQSMSNYSRYLTQKTALFFGSSLLTGYLAWSSHKNALYMDTPQHRGPIEAARESASVRNDIEKEWIPKFKEMYQIRKNYKVQGYGPNDISEGEFVKKNIENKINDLFPDPDESIKSAKRDRNIFGVVSLGLFALGIHQVMKLCSK